MFSLSRAKKLSVSFLIGLLLVVSACDDFFETDISQNEIELVSPADGVGTEFLVQTFSWELLKGANFYRLQIVSTSFDNIELMVLDTVIVKTSFTHELFPGEFEWRVKGLNYTSETAYSTRSLTILSGGEAVKDFLLTGFLLNNRMTDKTLGAVFGPEYCNSIPGEIFGPELWKISRLLDLTIHLPAASEETNRFYREFASALSCSSMAFSVPVNVFTHKFFTKGSHVSLII